MHNALVLNLRSGDAHLDVRGRSPRSPFLSLSLSLIRESRSSHFHISLSLSPLDLLAPLAQAADGVAT